MGGIERPVGKHGVLGEPVTERYPSRDFTDYKFRAAESYR